MGLRDAELRDAEPRDVGLRDAGLQDAGLQDAGLQDAGLQDAGLQTAELAACRRKTSEVSKGIFAGIITGIIQPIWRQIRLLKLPKSSRITLSDRLLENVISEHLCASVW